MTEGDPTDEQSADAEELTVTLTETGAPQSGARGGGTASAPQASSTNITDTYYQRDEIVRERRGHMEQALRTVAMVTLVGAAALQLGQQRPPSHYPVTALLVCIAVVAFVQTIRLRRGSTTPDTLVMGAVGPLVALAALAGLARVGVLSVAAMPLVMLVYFFGMTDMRGRAWLVYVCCAIGYLALALLAVPGWLPVLANVYVADLPGVRSALLQFGFVEIILALTFLLARRGRTQTLEAMAALESAQGEIRRREALLEEARLDLARALGAGRVGRLSGHDVGSYTVRELLGRGGMGEVYRAEHRTTGEAMALKVLHPHLQQDTDHLVRFLREAQVSSDLDSAHVVKIRQTGVAEDGSPFLAMELLEGRDLADVLREKGTLPLSDVLGLVDDACRALQAAHDAGIIHRDIKPQNLFLCTDGSVKVLDFGISKMANVAATMTHKIMGTPGYMSPEQVRGSPMDTRSDVFSLGAVVYRALTGRPAFTGGSPAAVAHQVVNEMPQRPSTLAELNVDIDRALALALAKDSKQRYESASLFARSLTQASQGELPESLRERAAALLRERPWTRRPSVKPPAER